MWCWRCFWRPVSPPLPSAGTRPKDVYKRQGYDCPKVGVLACVEKLNPKMPETVEGDALKQMNQRGELTGCVVEGPISYDCAVSREIAAFKGFESPCAGDCDVLVAPCLLYTSRCV